MLFVVLDARKPAPVDVTPAVVAGGGGVVVGGHF
jgi:hypothetical protein